MRVRDNSRPEKFDFSNVEITVLKDNSPPRFTPAVYFANLNETNKDGDFVKTLTAIDDDLRVS